MLVLVAIVWGILWEADEQSLPEAPLKQETLKATTEKPLPEKRSENLPPAAVHPSGAQDEAGDPGAKDTRTQDLLVLRTSSRTWAEIYGANGERLLFEMLTSGETPVRIRGQAPFRILLGHSPDVTVELNGRSIDQSHFNRSNNTAHFLVDATGAHRVPAASRDR